MTHSERPCWACGGSGGHHYGPGLCRGDLVVAKRVVEPDRPVDVVPGRQAGEKVDASKAAVGVDT
jgi:hypothetical protein